MGERLPRITIQIWQRIPGSQARQLHLTILRLPGIISELFDIGLAASAFHSRSLKEL